MPSAMEFPVHRPSLNSSLETPTTQVGLPRKLYQTILCTVKCPIIRSQRGSDLPYINTGPYYLPAANACSLSLYDADATSSTSTSKSADGDEDAADAVTLSSEIALIEDDVS